MKGIIFLGALTVFAIADFRSSAFNLKKRQEGEDVSVAEFAPVPLDLGDNFKYETFSTEERKEDVESGNGNEVNSDVSNKTVSAEDGSGLRDSGNRYYGSWDDIWGDDSYEDGAEPAKSPSAEPSYEESPEVTETSSPESPQPEPSSPERAEEVNDVEKLPVVTETKRDCRRIKFQSANPEIDVLIAVDTNLPECLEGLGEGEELKSGATVAETKASKQPKTQEIIVYKNDYLSGPSEAMTLTRGLCSNVPSGYNDEISSIDTKGACVIIHEHSDCVGKSAKLRPEATFVSQQLHRIRMNDDISSLELC